MHNKLYVGLLHNVADDFSILYSEFFLSPLYNLSGDKFTTSRSSGVRALTVLRTLPGLVSTQRNLRNAIGPCVYFLTWQGPGGDATAKTQYRSGVYYSYIHIMHIFAFVSFVALMETRLKRGFYPTQRTLWTQRPCVLAFASVGYVHAFVALNG